MNCKRCAATLAGSRSQTVRAAVASRRPAAAGSVLPEQDRVRGAIYTPSRWASSTRCRAAAHILHRPSAVRPLRVPLADVSGLFSRRARGSAPLVVCAALVLAAAPLAATCPAAAPVLLAAINGERAAAALAPLRLVPALCAVAQERAAEMARGGELEPPLVEQVTRSLQRRGYRAHQWHERTVTGPRTATALLTAWRDNDAESFRQTALGEHEDFGVGVVDDGEGPPVWVLLVATPRLRFEERLARPLGDLETVRNEVLAAVNAERRHHRLPPLVADSLLAGIAQRHADDMRRRRYYDHRSPEGTTMRTRAAALGVRRRTFGENLARGIFSPDEVVARWMGSSGHRRNILHPDFARLGVGMSVGTRGDDVDVLWVQLFASER